MKALLEAGVHFGHRTRRWNPKMRPYIFTKRNGIHIIDLTQTLSQMKQVEELVQKTTSNDGAILFVGTKRQAQDTIQQEAERRYNWTHDFLNDCELLGNDYPDRRAGPSASPGRHACWPR